MVCGATCISTPPVPMAPPVMRRWGASPPRQAWILSSSPTTIGFCPSTKVGLSGRWSWWAKRFTTQNGNRSPATSSVSRSARMWLPMPPIPKPSSMPFRPRVGLPFWPIPMSATRPSFCTSPTSPGAIGTWKAMPGSNCGTICPSSRHGSKAGPALSSMPFFPTWPAWALFPRRWPNGTSCYNHDRSPL